PEADRHSPEHAVPEASARTLKRRPCSSKVEARDLKFEARGLKLHVDDVQSAAMGSVNKVILVGNLGRDAELRYTPGGAAVATLNMATTEVWNDKAGQRQEKTEWHRVVLWGKSAESLSEYLTKGKQIYVEGRLQTRQWDDKDGNK